MGSPTSGDQRRKNWNGESIFIFIPTETISVDAPKAYIIFRLCQPEATTVLQKLKVPPNDVVFCHSYRGTSSKKTLLTTLSVREVRSSAKDRHHNDVQAGSQTKMGDGTNNPSSPAKNNNSGKSKHYEQIEPNTIETCKVGHSIV